MTDELSNEQVALNVSKAILEGDWVKLDSLLGPSFTYNGDGMHFSRDEYIGFMQDLYLSMSGMDMKFLQILTEDEFVTVRFKNSMTNTGKFMDMPATKKDIVIEGIFIRQVRDGKVIEENQTTNLIGIITQMGFKALFRYSISVGLFKVHKKIPVRKTIQEMTKLMGR